MEIVERSRELEEMLTPAHNATEKGLGEGLVHHKQAGQEQILLLFKTTRCKRCKEWSDRSVQGRQQHLGKTTGKYRRINTGQKVRARKMKQLWQYPSLTELLLILKNLLSNRSLPQQMYNHKLLSVFHYL